MVIGPFVKTLGYTTIAVDVQLALERLVLSLIEVARHDRFGEFIRLVDTECLAVGLPGDDIFHSVPFIHINQHLVQLDRKR